MRGRICPVALQMCAAAEISPVSEMKVSAGSSIHVPCHLFMLRRGKDMLYLISLCWVPKFLQLNYSDFSVQMDSKLKLGKLENLGGKKTSVGSL